MTFISNIELSEQEKQAYIDHIIEKNGKKPMLCACDIYRPAAIDLAFLAPCEKSGGFPACYAGSAPIGRKSYGQIYHQTCTADDNDPAHYHMHLLCADSDAASGGTASRRHSQCHH